MELFWVENLAQCYLPCVKGDTISSVYSLCLHVVFVDVIIAIFSLKLNEDLFSIFITSNQKVKGEKVKMCQYGVALHYTTDQKCSTVR